MGKLAFVFPGQASQVPGMGRELHDRNPRARRAFERADAALGFPLSKVCFDGSDAELQLTENTQPTILAVSVAAWEACRERLPAPDFVAGHSLGEYSALVAAGALSIEDAVRTVRQRGRFMQEAVPVGEGAMAALIGLDETRAAQACAAAAAATGGVVTPANLNGGGQIVIAGHRAAVERAMSEAKAAGAKLTKLLNVSAPFHCPLMAPAAERLAPVLRGLDWSDLKIPLVNNADAVLVSAGSAALDGLIRQVASPVRWEAGVRELAARGVDTFVEVGPLKVLTGLIKRILPNARLLNVEDTASLDAAAAALGTA